MTKQDFARFFLRGTTIIAQWLLSTTFLFSGFVKILDPEGMRHKLEAYLNVWQLRSLQHPTLLHTAVILLAMVEFMLGLYLLLGMRRRIASTMSVLLMLGMTVVTTYTYIYTPVADCGCFGDALILTHEETLIKNLILLTCAGWIFFRRSDILRIVSEHNQWLLSLYSLIYGLSVSLYSLRYLPVIDFTGFDIGVDIPSALIGKYQNTFVYTKNGEKKSFDEDHLPDSTWTFVTAETKVLNAPQIKEFALLEKNGEDISSKILNDSSYTFLLVSPDLSTADTGCSDAINDLFDYAMDHHLPFYFATASNNKDIAQWIDRTGAAYPFVWSSQEMLKAAVRSNPGLLLLKNGQIIQKWSNHNMPLESEISNQIKASIKTIKNIRQEKVLHLLLWFIIPFSILYLIDRIWMGKRLIKVYSYRKTLKNNSQ